MVLKRFSINTPGVFLAVESHKYAELICFQCESTITHSSESIILHQREKLLLRLNFITAYVTVRALQNSEERHLAVFLATVCGSSGSRRGASCDNRWELHMTYCLHTESVSCQACGAVWVVMHVISHGLYYQTPLDNSHSHFLD